MNRSSAARRQVAADPTERLQARGFTVRQRYGPCPVCKAPQDRWCDPDCKAIDLGDYR